MYSSSSFFFHPPSRVLTSWSSLYFHFVCRLFVPILCQLDGSLEPSTSSQSFPLPLLYCPKHRRETRNWRKMEGESVAHEWRVFPDSLFSFFFSLRFKQRAERSLAFITSLTRERWAFPRLLHSSSSFSSPGDKMPLPSVYLQSIYSYCAACSRLHFRTYSLLLLALGIRPQFGTTQFDERSSSVFAVCLAQWLTSVLGSGW